MGSTISNGSDKNHHNTEPINSKDIDIIKLTWNEVPNKEELGIAIMVRIFQEHKEIKSKWIFATNLETEAEMLSNSQVRYHARKIIDVISRIVDKAIHTPNIQELSIDEFNLIKLGRSHFHYGVRREHFVHFEEGLLYALKKFMPNKIEFNAKAEKAWRKVFWLIANTLCDGIELEMKDKKGIEDGDILESDNKHSSSIKPERSKSSFSSNS